MAPAQHIRELLDLAATGERAEHLLETIANATAAELDDVLAAVDADELVARIERCARRAKLRGELWHLLGRDRLPDLGVGARAALVRVLARGRTHALRERAIRDILLGTHGERLTALKNVLDTEGGHRDLQRLVFRDVDDAALRAEILEHFRGEAASAQPRELKILSDVDDTFYANWKDERFPPKTVYPGVLALYRELDRGPHTEPGREGDLAFVTARPDDHLGVVESRTLRSLRKRGVAQATVLSGSFRKIFGNASIAAKKYENFTQYEQLFPEYDFVFVGDSGQGDVSLGETLLAEHGDRVKAVLIHDVVSTPEATRAAYRPRRVHFFDTYVGAALSAAVERLIQPEGVERVARAAMEDFARIRWKHVWQRDTRWSELCRDMAAAGLPLP